MSYVYGGVCVQMTRSDTVLFHITQGCSLDQWKENTHRFQKGYSSLCTFHALIAAVSCFPLL